MIGAVTALLGLFIITGPSGVGYGQVTAKSYDPTPWTAIACPNHRGCTRTEHPDCWRLDVRLGPLTGSRCVARAVWDATAVGDWAG